MMEPTCVSPLLSSVAFAKEGGGDPGSSSAAQPSADPQGVGEGDEATYLELIKKAIKQRQKHAVEARAASRAPTLAKEDACLMPLRLALSGM